jgi:Domain of unknown function (DUF4261)
MSKSFLALVLLEAFATPDMIALAEAIRARHPELPVEIEGGSDESARRGSPLIRCGDELVAVMSMPAPIPEDPDLWSRASKIWPQAKAALAQHRGHLIVSLLGRDKPPLQTARLMTAVIGALIATMPQCRAVVWNGKVVRPVDLWLDLSTQSLAPFPDYPSSLWIDMLPFRSDVGIGAVTMGLSAFAEREIEFETRKLTLATLMEKVDGLSVYLVEHGRVVKDGDTFGRDASERFSVRYENSDRFGGLPVFFCYDSTK